MLNLHDIAKELGWISNSNVSELLISHIQKHYSMDSKHAEALILAVAGTISKLEKQNGTTTY